MTTVGQPCAELLAVRLNGLTRPFHAPCLWPRQPAEHAQQGGLARSVWAANQLHRAGWDLERKILEQAVHPAPQCQINGFEHV